MTTLARYQGFALDDAGNVLASPTVEVRDEATTALAVLFSDRAGASGIGNPFTGASDGLIAFHVIGGSYKITVTKGGVTRTLRYVAIGTAAEMDGTSPWLGGVRARVSSAAAGDISPDVSAADLYVRTALSAAIAINAPTGSPTVGDRLAFRLKDNGTGRALTWNAIFRAIGVTIPTTTVANKTTYVRAIYNTTDTKWDVINVNTEA
jgi:hypothetical protein